jgi:hypothetical protein
MTSSLPLFHPLPGQKERAESGGLRPIGPLPWQWISWALGVLQDRIHVISQ